MGHSNNENGGGRNGYGDPAPQPNGETPIAPKHGPRDDIVKDYEGQLHKAKCGAWIVGGLHSASRFLAFCNLTWATAVILGGFSSQLSPLDFAFVSVLLLIEAFRLATTVFFCRLATRSLHTLSQSPFIPKKKDRQAKAVWVVRVLSILLQILFISPSFALPSLRLHSRPWRLSDVRNLNVSLQIFYAFILANGAIALLAVFCSVVLLWLLYDQTEQSVHRYYDEVLQRSFDHGVEKADDFRFLEFAVEMLGHDFSRQLGAEDIQKNKKQLIKYLHGNRNGQDAVLLAFDSSDCFIQRAAVCLVGFWAKEKLLEVPAHLPPALLTKLADKLGALEIGWSAANSLAALDPITVLSITNSAGKPAVDILISLIHPTRKRSLVYLRALANWLLTEPGSTPSAELQQACKKLLEILNGNDELVGNLRTLLTSSKLNRIRVSAGYLLMCMDKLNTEDECRPIELINTQNDAYTLPCEEVMLRELQRHAAIRVGNGGEAFAPTLDINWAGPSTTGTLVIRSH